MSYHPLIFEKLKKNLTGGSEVERILIKAIKNDIAIFSAHTNLDVINGGVSQRLAEEIRIMSGNPLQPLSGKLSKVVVFVPASHVGPVTDALYGAGAGTIGNYDHCSFQSPGEGTYRPGNESNLQGY
ncbi:MAG: Nif3-like dinuclear metal center hexameric protein [Bacteroidales bacterium]